MKVVKKIKRVNNSEGNSNYSQLRDYKIYHFDNSRISSYDDFFLEGSPSPSLQ